MATLEQNLGSLARSSHGKAVAEWGEPGGLALERKQELMSTLLLQLRREMGVACGELVENLFSSVTHVWYTTLQQPSCTLLLCRHPKRRFISSYVSDQERHYSTWPSIHRESFVQVVLCLPILTLTWCIQANALIEHSSGGQGHCVCHSEGAND